ncbi:zinc-binding oxidoreductase [Leptospira perolatii]|uniref:Zinc-binding oxidoreductase n=1 Tax=Leptospira perolatii TaxID=2023191 RepID=A0A2M9ZJQ1_9LEPT|nr:NADP-dependent oxidoreductase [Leptospira perolatii]PJZ68862.1 zinc-binding oxidoreductase [Leptospira perolatii]PJZ72193.1 zinc-binding oxidoreductase [Leptospira perolatii]
MKAIQFRKFGGPDHLELVEMPDPIPGEGEYLIKIKAAGVNPVDWKIREGGLQSRMHNQLPIIPGWEFSGTITNRGFSAKRFQVGEDVFSYCRRPWIEKGAYAEMISVPESYLCPKPKSITHEEAATVPLAGLTAYQCLFQATVCKKGDTVLILGASGGVGSMATQLAVNAGAHVIAVSSARNQEYLKNLGAMEWIDYNAGSIRKALLERKPEGVDIVLDFVGGETFTESLGCIRPGGSIVSILVNTPATNLNLQSAYIFVEPNVKQLSELAQLIDEGKLKVHVSEVFSLSEAAKAHEKISRLHTRGKIVLKVS